MESSVSQQPAAEPAAQTPERKRPPRDNRRAAAVAFQKYALILAWLVVVIVFCILKPDTYATSGNFQTIFGSQAVLLILALGLIVPLTSGDFDLSIAAVLSLASMVLAILQVRHGWSLFPAIVVVLAIGLFIGLINGALVTLLEIDSFIVTLGSATVIQGIVLWISGSNTVSGVSDGLINWTITNRFLGISMVFWYGVLLTIFLWYVFVYTALGRRLLFVGRGRNVSRLSGINVGHVRWGALATSAFVASIAGIFYAGSLGGADPTSGLAFLLPAFAAAFLGATAIQPGRFNPIGTFVAVFFLVSGITGLQLLGADSFVQQLFYGGALILAVALSQIVRRKDIKDEAAASNA